MKLPTQVHRLGRYLRSLPKKYYIFSFVGILVLFYGITFFIPKTVAFSYGGETCTKQLTLFPSLHKPTTDQYSVEFKDMWRIGSLDISSMKACFTPTSPPKEGTIVTSTAPFGGFFARKHFAISVPKAPVANLGAMTKAVPVTKPLKVPLSSGDKIYEYSLKIADKSVPCEGSNEGVACDIVPLKLTQGAEYQYSLTKRFQDEKPAKVGDGKVETLKAVAVAESTVKSAQTIYDRPKSLSFTMDKPIDRAKTTLILDGKPINTTQSIEENVLTLALGEELPREKTFELTIDKVEAKDESTLVEPYKIQFATSGGPKVTNVSVGSTGVSQSAGIVLTFDQNLSKTKDVLQFVKFEGGTATVQKRSDNQVVVQLSNLPLCQPFSITIDPGIPSEHDLTTSQPWKFAGRTICYTAFTYGSSVKGRPLVGYVFGSSGPVTMYVGAIHGNEPSSSVLMKAWVSELEANPTRIEGKRVVVVPTINPDGIAANSRMNARGVNLSRNFPTSNWTRAINDTDGRHENGGGEAPLSEPESAAIARLTTQYRPRLLLSFHAIGSLVVGDPGGYSAGYAAKYASMVRYRDVTNSSTSSFDYDITGAYEDWTYRNQGIPSMVIELNSYTSASIATHRAALWAMME